MLSRPGVVQSAFENWLRSRESSGHQADHGDVDDGFVVAGSGLAGAHATTVLDDPAERAFHHPDVEFTQVGQLCQFALDRFR